MSLLTHLNLNYLRIFLVVYRTRSMTQAAKELHLTQSGVSQQIKSLEETLDITLFDRVNRRIIPTSEADILYQECSRRLDDLEKALRQISNQDKELIGTVRIGLPPIFGQQTLAPLIGQFALMHPKVCFELTTGLVSDLTPLLLKGQLDFAFVDSISKDNHLGYYELVEQSLHMVYPANWQKENSSHLPDFTFFSHRPFVSYTESESMIRAWFQANFNQPPSRLHIRCSVMDCNTALHFTKQGLGATLLPKTMLSQLGKDVVVTDQVPFKNKISVCRLNKRTMGITAERCLSWIIDQLMEA